MLRPRNAVDNAHFECVSGNDYLIRGSKYGNRCGMARRAGYDHAHKSYRGKFHVDPIDVTVYGYCDSVPYRCAPTDKMTTNKLGHSAQKYEEQGKKEKPSLREIQEAYDRK